MKARGHITIEDRVKQPIKELYLSLFEHHLSEVSCCSIADNVLAIVLEQATIPSERVLVLGGQKETAKVFRKQMNVVFERGLRAMLADLCKTPVIDVLCQHQFETGRMSLMIIFKSLS